MRARKMALLALAAPFSLTLQTSGDVCLADSAHSLYQRGMVHKRRKEWASAIKAFQLSLSLAPDMLETHHALAWTYVAVGDEGSAIKHFQRVVALAPHSPRGRDAAKALLRLQSREKPTPSPPAAASTPKRSPPAAQVVPPPKPAGPPLPPADKVLMKLALAYAGMDTLSLDGVCRVQMRALGAQPMSLPLTVRYRRPRRFLVSMQSPDSGWEVRCDGVRMSVSSSAAETPLISAAPTALPTPDTLGLTELGQRLWPLPCLLLAAQDPYSFLTPPNGRLEVLGREVLQLGGKNVHTLWCRLQHRFSPAAGQDVWLDPNTGLVRQVREQTLLRVRGESGKAEPVVVSITQRYERLAINDRLDDGAFALPAAASDRSGGG